MQVWIINNLAGTQNTFYKIKLNQLIYLPFRVLGNVRFVNFCFVSFLAVVCVLVSRDTKTFCRQFDIERQNLWSSKSCLEYSTCEYTRVLHVWVLQRLAHTAYKHPRSLETPMSAGTPLQRHVCHRRVSRSNSNRAFFLFSCQTLDCMSGCQFSRGATQPAPVNRSWNMHSPHTPNQVHSRVRKYLSFSDGDGFHAAIKTFTKYELCDYRR